VVIRIFLSFGFGFKQVLFRPVRQDQTVTQQVVIGNLIENIMMFPPRFNHVAQLHQPKMLRRALQGRVDRGSDFRNSSLLFCQEPQDQDTLGITENLAEHCLVLRQPSDIGGKNWLYHDLLHEFLNSYID
jgi:hypothetical protein